jgi:hypothetical protein
VSERTVFEFGSPREILAAAEELRVLGAPAADAYTPFAMPALEELLGIRRTRIPRLVLASAALGCATAFLILWATNTYDYPLDVGGRPLLSLPADVPIMFETTVLFGSLAAFFGVLLASGLPRLYRPVFEVPGIQTASLDRFWLAVDHPGPLDERVLTRMRALGALAVQTTTVRE